MATLKNMRSIAENYQQFDKAQIARQLTIAVSEIARLEIALKAANKIIKKYDHTYREKHSTQQDGNLSGQQLSELRWLRDSLSPQWSNCPPEKADAWLGYYIAYNLVESVGSGYIITEAGRSALAEERKTK